MSNKLKELREEWRKNYEKRNTKQESTTDIEFQTICSTNFEYFLPEEILVHIFSFLSPHDLSKISLTCSSWFELQKDNDIWSFLFSKIFSTKIDTKEKEYGFYRQTYLKRLLTRTNWYKGIGDIIYLNMTPTEYIIKGNVPKSWQSDVQMDKSQLFSMDLLGERLITGDANGLLNLWDMRTGQMNYTMKGHKGYITKTIIKPDMVYSTSYSDAKVFVWNLNYGVCTGKLRKDTSDSIGFTDFKVNDNKLIGYSQNQNYEIIDIKKDKTILNVQNPHPNSQITGFDFQENTLFSISSTEKMIKLFDLRIGICVKKILSKDFVGTTQFNDKFQITSLTSNHQYTKFGLTTFDISTGKEIKKLNLESYNGHQFCTFDDEKIIRAGSSGTLINNRTTGKLECQIPSDNLSCMTTDESRLIFGLTTGGIVIRDYGCDSELYWKGLKGGRTLVHYGPKFKLSKTDALDPLKWGINEGKFEKYYIPYWKFETKGPIYYQAKVGEEIFVGSYENGEEIYRKKVVITNISSNVNLPLSDSIYASENFSRYYLDEMTPEFNAESITQISPQERKDSKIDVYTIDKVSAWKILFEKKFKKFLTNYIENDIRKNIKNLKGNITIEITRINFDLNDIDATLLYHPMYISEYDYGGRNFFIYVNGINGFVKGERLYSFTKVANASAIALFTSTVLVFGLRALNPMTAFICSLFGLPIGALFYFIPFIGSIIRNFRRQQRIFEFREQKRNKTGFGYEQRSNSYQNSQSNYQKQRYSKSKESTKDDYYTILGLDPSKRDSYSSDQIRKSFLKMAKSFHPDRFSDPKEKENAHKKFTQINQAYQTLKDEQSRADYDVSKY
eukprot:gene2698-3894_t